MTHPPILSVSQVEDFDPEQLGGCPRRWWFERVKRVPFEASTAHEDGHAGHALLKLYLTGSPLPKRARMLTAVRGAIDAGRLPRPGPHLEVEHRFSGQPHYDAAGAFIPLDLSQTLWHAGHPWEGFIDLRFRHRDGTVTVWDHKFSSDIHARALPAERLIRTVQMPIYALDTLRHWPDARAVNLVHLYVSRRGVESFIRHQRVSIEQVRERAEEIAGLVHQMDAARGAATQDDVPFNWVACHARTGCPHQSRCTAFRRKSMGMQLDDEDAKLFGLLDEKSVAGPSNFNVVHASEGKHPWSGPGEEQRARDPSGLNLDDIFEDMPKPSTPKPQPAPEECGACGVVLTPENSSRLQSGEMKHIKCPAAPPAVSSKDLQSMADELNGEAAQAREQEQRLAEKCPNCPHPDHGGRPCGEKRGRGTCRCGAVAEQPQRHPVPPAPTFADDGKPKHSAAELRAMADEAARAADVDGDGAAVEEARILREAAEQAEREEEASGPTPSDYQSAYLRADRAEADLARAKAKIESLGEALQTANTALMNRSLAEPPTAPWSGTLQVNVVVELGPSTLAFLAALVKR